MRSKWGIWLAGVGTLAVVVCTFVLAPDGALERVAGAGTVIVGLASGLGAAAAAYFSWRSAQQSNDAAHQIQQIAEDSQQALGKATKPSIECVLELGSRETRLHVTNEGGWPARDVTARIEIPRIPSFGVHVGDLGTSPARRRAVVSGLPAVTEPDQGWPRGAGGRAPYADITSKVSLGYSDQERIFRYSDVIRVTTPVLPETSYVFDAETSAIVSHESERL